MTEPDNNEPAIRAAFEAALIKGLKGEPLTNKDGAVVDANGEVLLGAPDASFLSVVRAYLKDLKGPDGAPKAPQTGKPRDGGLLDNYLKGAGKGLPFGRPQ
ncbi:hypothetical protein QTI51_09665 [Variovorax sp. J22G73]|uniref:hypothetical protein n=1 Tax=unclassified Variovorax TaxID=663243 RepID=UPI0025764C43|nr:MULTISPECIES: hypothetical protein [unclassified Variovorax]MDM0006433.1 hypothetical protein [Variovorax sp. J22R203]MDM0097544.1 hypothetical protein [Variovorax sp. J22G73]